MLRSGSVPNLQVRIYIVSYPVLVSDFDPNAFPTDSCGSGVVARLNCVNPSLRNRIVAWLNRVDSSLTWGFANDNNPVRPGRGEVQSTAREESAFFIHLATKTGATYEIAIFCKNLFVSEAIFSCSQKVFELGSGGFT